MSDVSKIKVNNVDYNIKDTTARNKFNDYYTKNEIDTLIASVEDYI